MSQNPLRVITFAVIGLLIGMILLALLSTRTSDLGVLGIAMTLGVEAIFFVLAVYVIEPTSADGTFTDEGRGRISTAPRYSRGWAIVLMSMAILVFTVVVAVFFDSFNLLLAQLIALDELNILTERADLALQVTVGGYFALLFWLPAIFLTSFAVGSRSVPLRYWDCFLASFISLGIFVVLNFLIEIWAGQLSIELLFSMMFNAAGSDTIRLPAERGVFVMVLAALLIITLLALSTLLSFGAWLGRRRRAS